MIFSENCREKAGKKTRAQPEPGLGSEEDSEIVIGNKIRRLKAGIQEGAKSGKNIDPPSKARGGSRRSGSFLRSLRWSFSAAGVHTNRGIPRSSAPSPDAGSCGRGLVCTYPGNALGRIRYGF